MTSSRREEISSITLHSHGGMKQSLPSLLFMLLGNKAYLMPVQFNLRTDGIHIIDSSFFIKSQPMWQKFTQYFTFSKYPQATVCPDTYCACIQIDFYSSKIESNTNCFKHTMLFIKYHKTLKGTGSNLNHLINITRVL